VVQPGRTSPEIVQGDRHAGGDEALHRLEELFYSKVLADTADAVHRAAAASCRSPDLVHRRVVGRPDRFTRNFGFQHIIDVHHQLKITDE
jgi:hemoglobin